jgi:hypothetical protein
MNGGVARWPMDPVMRPEADLRCAEHIFQDVPGQRAAWNDRVWPEADGPLRDERWPKQTLFDHMRGGHLGAPSADVRAGERHCRSSRDNANLRVFYAFVCMKQRGGSSRGVVHLARMTQGPGIGTIPLDVGWLQRLDAPD